MIVQILYLLVYAEKFLNGDQDKEKHFYSIKLAKGTPVIVSPFSIIRKYDSYIDSMRPNGNYTLAISNLNDRGQQEITLFKNLFSYKEYDNRIIQDEAGNINLHYAEVYLKENTYSDNELKSK